MDLKLLPWEMRYLDTLVRLAGHPDIPRFLRNSFPAPYTRADGIEFLNSVRKRPPVNEFAIFADGALCGGISIRQMEDIYCKNAEIGYWLGVPFQGKGIMTRAVQLMVRYGFSTFNVERIFACVFGENTASRKVLEKSGFVLENIQPKILWKNNEFLDDYIYAIRKSDYLKNYS